MEKVLKMAEGIDIGEMRTYELVPSRKLKRYRSPSDSECQRGYPSLLGFGGHEWERGESNAPQGCLRESQHSKLRGGDCDVLC